EVVLEPVRNDDLKRIEISIGEDGKATVVGDGEDKNVEVRKEGGGFIILNQDDGKIIRKIQVNPQEKGPVTALMRLASGQVLDPATREALEKLMGGLKEEAGRLSNEGKKDEAERKLQSLRALDSLLNPAAQWKMLTPPGPEPGLFGRRALHIEEAGPAA